MLRRALPLFALLVPFAAHATAPQLIPVTGYLTDATGAPVNNQVDLQLKIYATANGGSAIWQETQTVNVDNGQFTVYLGEQSPVDLAIFDNNPALYIGMAVDNGAEMTPRFTIATAPYAGYAQYCDDAASVGGIAATDLRQVGDQVSWNDLSGVPNGLSDGDQDTLYTAGTGLSLSAQNQFSVDQPTVEGWAKAVAYDTLSELRTQLDSVYQAKQSCPAGNFLTSDGSGGWTCTSTSTFASGSQLTTLNTNLDGIQRACPSFGTQTYNASSGSWSSCPSTWTCGTSPTHAGCVSSSQYASCKAILADASFVSSGQDGLYYIDPDGNGANNPPFQAVCNFTLAGGGWTLAVNLDTNDGTMRDYNDVSFWLADNSIGPSNAPLQNDFKSLAYGSVPVNEILIWAHQEGLAFSSPAPLARYAVSNPNAGKTFLQLMQMPADTQLAAAPVQRTGTVSAPGAYARNAGDVFIDDGLPLIVNSTGAGGTDAKNTVRIGTDFTAVCSTVSCNGHNVQGGYGGYHHRPSSGDYPLSYEAEPSFGYHPGEMGFGTNFVNNNGCGNSVWTNTCAPTVATLQVDFAIWVR